MRKTMFTNGKILDIENKTVIPGAILVEDGVIRAVGAGFEAPAEAETVDLGGQFVGPGLFNCHTHILINGEPDPDYNEPDTVLILKAVENCRKYLETGVTFIRDAGGLRYYDLELRAARNAGMFAGPEMQVSGKSISMTGGHGWKLGIEADGPDAVRRAAREQVKRGVDWIKIMATGGVMTKSGQPGSAQLTEEELRAAIEEAHKAGIKTATHAQGEEGIKNALRAGIDSIEHGFFLDEWCFDWMKEHNVFYVPTLAAPYWILKNGVKSGIPQWAVEKTERAAEAHTNSFREAYKAGVKIALGTDAGTPFNYHDMTGYEMILMVEYGMAPWDALRTGTVNAAELCGVPETHGTVAAGKRANLAVFGGNPAEEIRCVLDVRMTVLGGEVVFCK